MLAITDHEKTNDVTGLSSENFLVLSGIENNEMTLRCSAVKEAHLIGCWATGQSFYADNKDKIMNLKCPLDKKWKYVRVKLVDWQGNRAWTNPFILS